ncbi:MAG: hypothetical protein PVJ81_05590 [Dehalococcoidia bacterium]|jgi:hypothetical protein
MADSAKRPRYFLDIDPELRNRVKAAAALQGKTMREWMLDAITEKLEGDASAGESPSTLGDVESSTSLRGYLAPKMRGRRI